MGSAVYGGAFEGFDAHLAEFLDLPSLTGREAIGLRKLVGIEITAAA